MCSANHPRGELASFFPPSVPPIAYLSLYLFFHVRYGSLLLKNKVNLGVTNVQRAKKTSGTSPNAPSQSGNPASPPGIDKADTGNKLNMRLCGRGEPEDLGNTQKTSRAPLLTIKKLPCAALPETLLFESNCSREYRSTSEL